jgi:hypothetical protein
MLSNGEHVWTRKTSGGWAANGPSTPSGRSCTPSGTVEVPGRRVRAGPVHPGQRHGMGRRAIPIPAAAITNNWKIYDQSNPVATATKWGGGKAMLAPKRRGGWDALSESDNVPQPLPLPRLRHRDRRAVHLARRTGAGAAGRAGREVVREQVRRLGRVPASTTDFTQRARGPWATTTEGFYTPGS